MRARYTAALQQHSDEQPGQFLPPDFNLADDEYHLHAADAFAANPDAVLWKGALAGAAAGLAAGYAMVKFQELWSRLQDDQKKQDIPAHRIEAQREDARNSDVEKDQPVDEERADATVKVANRISKTFANYELSRSDAEFAGPAVHYAFSAAIGALYGTVGEIAPVVRAGFGNAFGAALFVVADEVAVPVMHLSKPPQEVPLSKHLYGLVSHLVYGSTTEGLFRLLRGRLDNI